MFLLLNPQSADPTKDSTEESNPKWAKNLSISLFNTKLLLGPVFPQQITGQILSQTEADLTAQIRSARQPGQNPPSRK
jgi:hypothetical protein